MNPPPIWLVLLVIVVEAFLFGAGRALGAWVIDRVREHFECGRPLWPLREQSHGDFCRCERCDYDGPPSVPSP